MATSPAWGSIMILVNMKVTGPLESQFIIALPTSVSRSPFQMTGIRTFWASCGFGTWVMTMSSRTSWTGDLLARVFWSPFLQYS